MKTKSFHSAMPGAPVLSGTAGALLSVLDAVLVTGFGLQSVTSLVVSGGIATATVPATPSAGVDAVILVAGASIAALNGEQRVTAVGANAVSWATTAPDGAATGAITLKVAAAGWNKAFTGANLAAYKSNSVEGTGFYLRVDDTGTTTARVRGFEAMSDVSTGSGLFPSAAQFADGLWWSKSNAASGAAVQWRIHADDRGFYFFVKNLGAGGEYQGNYFGDVLSLKSGDPYACVLRGNVSDKSSAAGGTFGDDLIFADGAQAYDGLYMARAANTLGGAVQVSSAPVMALGVAAAHVAGSVGFAYPLPADNGLMLTPVLLHNAQGPRGYLPGLRSSPQVVNTSFATGDTIAGSGDIVGQKVQAVRLGALITTPSQCGCVFINNVSDWRV
jgi:hypothetical protein